MVKASKLIILFLVVLIIVLAGCNAKETDIQQEYNKCTSVCSSTLEDDFVTLDLCMEECKKEFPKEG
ncbi:MAG: hypothetical protein QF436_02215 [Candidatus Woesearchaeota archaeon]|jgi:predicted small secreted protein|nr:hypothetical protein [Candidatus Woesearchaeota archaeon]|tara:strand:+ start:194 stop:394 length:201 start_codon:yes stop_codon:yes gene_type:complete